MKLFCGAMENLTCIPFGGDDEEVNKSDQKKQRNSMFVTAKSLSSKNGLFQLAKDMHRSAVSRWVDPFSFLDIICFIIWKERKLIILCAIRYVPKNNDACQPWNESSCQAYLSYCQPRGYIWLWVKIVICTIHSMYQIILHEHDWVHLDVRI